MILSVACLLAASTVAGPVRKPTHVPPAPRFPLVAPASDTGRAGPVMPAYVGSAQPIVVQPDTGHHLRRPRPIEYSDAYYTRLKIHMIASYATLPLFIAEYFIGQSLYNNPDSASRSLRGWHNHIALAIGGLFTVNTITGVANLWAGRKDPNGRARRYIHGISMLVADAGFVATALMTPSRTYRRSGGTLDQGSASLHKGIAIGSMSLSLASYLMMLVWKN